MNFENITRRRGTSIAAAALSLALVAPAVQPVVNPSAVPAAFAQDTAELAPAPEVSDQNAIIDADMIASGRVTKAANLTDAQGVGKGLISGHVYMATPGGNPGASYDNGNVKLDGITVYAQFRDKDGSYSPIFSAKTHTVPGLVGGNGGQGTFAFGSGKKGHHLEGQTGQGAHLGSPHGPEAPYLGRAVHERSWQQGCHVPPGQRLRAGLLQRPGRGSSRLLRRR